MNPTIPTRKAHRTPSPTLSACAILFALAAAQTLHAQQPYPSAKPAQPPALAHTPLTEEQDTPKPQKPGHEGIKVHGHWKLDVRNPDGKLVKTYEFENALVTPNSADVLLSQLLAGQAATAGWFVYLETTQNNGALCADTTTGYYSTSYWASCVLTPPAPIDTTLVAYYANCQLISCTPTLTVKPIPYNSTTKTPAYLQLQGSVTIPNAGPITSVSTYLVSCFTSGIATLTNVACNVPNPGAPNYTQAPAGTTIYDPTFTSTTLPTPLQISSGQVVTVTVAISFS